MKNNFIKKHDNRKHGKTILEKRETCENMEKQICESPEE